ncbi:MAG: hypothetical protein ACKO6Q_10015 [Bacteroidota bacterium]
MLRSRCIWPIILLLVFFVLHGWVDFFPIIPLSDAGWLCTIYLIIGIALAAMGRILLASWDQAYLFAFLLLTIEFFFGAAQDTLRAIAPSTILNKYSIQLPLVALGMILCWKLARRENLQSPKFQLYLRTVLIGLILADIGSFAFFKTKTRNNLSSINFTHAKKIPTDSLPDIYLIIADEYPGNGTLKNEFGFSNDRFTQELQRRGFYVADSAKSNYNFTEFSVASLFKMDYLRKMEGRNASLNHLRYCINTLRENPLTPQLRSMGYHFNNLSIFDFYEQPSPVKPYLLPGRSKPLSEQTFSGRVIRDVGYHLISDIPWNRDLFSLDELNLKNNQYLFDATIKTVEKTHPQFSYTHLIMPHSPYYFDRKGEMRPSPQWARRDSAAFIDYLIYTNDKLLELVDSIQMKSKKPVAILLIGDHGARNNIKELPEIHHFQTLAAILLPNRNYASFYPTISHVNLFRATLNSLFGEKLPYLKDSTVFLRE